MEQTLNIIQQTPEQLKLLVKEAVNEALNEQKEKEQNKSDKCLTRNKICEKYGLNYDRIKKLIEAGILKETYDNLIVEQSVINYKNNS